MTQFLKMLKELENSENSPIKSLDMVESKHAWLTKRPPAIMAAMATNALTAASPRASAMAWKPIWKQNCCHDNNIRIEAAVIVVTTDNKEARSTHGEIQ